MVLERILSEKWLEKRAELAFFLGYGYSIIGIIIASLIFQKDPSLPAIAFTSILLLPSLRRIFTLKGEVMEGEKGFSFSGMFRNNKDFIKIYIFLSLGIFLVYSTAAIVLPSFQVNKLFETQLGIRGVGGGAYFSTPLLWSILLNNWWVLLACFLISLLTGDGGIFMITWNLSVWGTIFGVTARNAAFVAGAPPFYFFLLIILIATPHAFLEILSYILGSISGGVISKGLRIEGFKSKKFKILFFHSLGLFIFAVIVLFLGGLVETWVLGNVGLYREIIAMSYLL